MVKVMVLLKRNKRVEKSRKSGSVPGRTEHQGARRARKRGVILDIELEFVKHGYNKLIKHDIIVDKTWI
jgi:hypothetical protein